jgi:hypothetical protein
MVSCDDHDFCPTVMGREAMPAPHCEQTNVTDLCAGRCTTATCPQVHRTSRLTRRDFVFAIAASVAALNAALLGRGF